MRIDQVSTDRYKLAPKRYGDRLELQAQVESQVNVAAELAAAVAKRRAERLAREAQVNNPELKQLE
jgi:hypothetical protein